ncbi:MAG: hypothetical protein KIT87_01695 [Anaerolineae bacterium]|nr:hypothetical protein [Anaerolineae bacterium]
MTARVFGYVCRTCGTVVTELTREGRCPVCVFYGHDGWLVEVDDRAVVMPWVVERSIQEPLPSSRRRVRRPASVEPKTGTRPSLLALLRGKIR